jgi:hypothetical protein
LLGTTQGPLTVRFLYGATLPVVPGEVDITPDELKTKAVAILQSRHGSDKDVQIHKDQNIVVHMQDPTER